MIELNNLIEAMSCGVPMATVRDFAVLIKAGQSRHGIGNDELIIGFFAPPVFSWGGASICLFGGQTEKRILGVKLV